VSPLLTLNPCGSFEGCGRAPLCFVVPDATGAPWQVIESTRYLEPMIEFIIGGVEGSTPSLSTYQIRTSVHIRISMCRSLCALTLVLILTGAVSGCAIYNTYEKCGFYGCPGDAKITAHILLQFRQRLDLEPNAIAVQTLDHVVYLYGLVSSSLEIYTAESIARRVPGVTGVVNSMVAQTR